MFCPGWQIYADVLSGEANLYVMFYQGGKYVCDASSRLVKLYVMFCPE